MATELNEKAKRRRARRRQDEGVKKAEAAEVKADETSSSAVKNDVTNPYEDKVREAYERWVGQKDSDIDSQDWRGDDLFDQDIAPYVSEGEDGARTWKNPWEWSEEEANAYITALARKREDAEKKNADLLSNSNPQVVDSATEQGTEKVQSSEKKEDGNDGVKVESGVDNEGGQPGVDSSNEVAEGKKEDGNNAAVDGSQPATETGAKQGVMSFDNLKKIVDSGTKSIMENGKVSTGGMVIGRTDKEVKQNLVDVAPIELGKIAKVDPDVAKSETEDYVMKTLSDIVKEKDEETRRLSKEMADEDDMQRKRERAYQIGSALSSIGDVTGAVANLWGTVNWASNSNQSSMVAQQAKSLEEFRDKYRTNINKIRERLKTVGSEKVTATRALATYTQGINKQDLSERQFQHRIDVDMINMALKAEGLQIQREKLEEYISKNKEELEWLKTRFGEELAYKYIAMRYREEHKNDGKKDKTEKSANYVIAKDKEKSKQVFIKTRDALMKAGVNIVSDPDYKMLDVYCGKGASIADAEAMLDKIAADERLEDITKEYGLSSDKKKESDDESSEIAGW